MDVTYLNPGVQADQRRCKNGYARYTPIVIGYIMQT